jgi:homoaconitate hydratase
MGSRDALAYLASPEVVAASALSGYISGPGSYQVPEGWAGVDKGFGTGTREKSTEQELGELRRLRRRREVAGKSEGNIWVI